MKLTYKHTVMACFAGYVVQAIVNNILPLLILTLQKTYQLSLDKLTLLITLNFVEQLLVDFISPRFVDKIGYRISLIIAHVSAAIGLFLMGFLPMHMNPYAALVISIFFTAIGGGLTEVLISPEIEACPTENKSGMMSLLHSFYCWGHVFVILLSTGFFILFGIENWRYLLYFWALIPIANTILFMFVPIYTLTEEGQSMPVRELVSSKIFWIFILIMVCAGASEQGMSQWASAFAESGLKVSKTIGDLAGPCFFAIMMGVSRLSYAGLSKKVDLAKIMAGSCVLCVFSYLLAAFSPLPLLGLLGCGLCGLSTGILWPGTFSLAAGRMPSGGTAMFAYFALAGDLGCSSGPTLVGFISDAFDGNLKKGLAYAIIFPILLIIGLRLYRREILKEG